MKNAVFLYIILFITLVIISYKSFKANQLKNVTPIQNDSNLIQDVNVLQFSKLIASKKGQLLDVRTPNEWEEGIINEAIKINYYDKDFEDQVGEKLSKNNPIYVYCKAGGRSRSAALQLQKMGFKNIYNLKGGIKAWKNNGNKLIK